MLSIDRIQFIGASVINAKREELIHFLDLVKKSTVATSIYSNLKVRDIINLNTAITSSRDFDRFTLPRMAFKAFSANCGYANQYGDVLYVRVIAGIINMTTTIMQTIRELSVVTVDVKGYANDQMCYNHGLDMAEYVTYNSLFVGCQQDYTSGIIFGDVLTQAGTCIQNDINPIDRRTKKRYLQHVKWASNLYGEKDNIKGWSLHIGHVPQTLKHITKFIHPLYSIIEMYAFVEDIKGDCKTMQTSTYGKVHCSHGLELYKGTYYYDDFYDEYSDKDHCKVDEARRRARNYYNSILMIVTSQLHNVIHPHAREIIYADNFYESECVQLIDVRTIDIIDAISKGFDFIIAKAYITTD